MTSASRRSRLEPIDIAPERGGVRQPDVRDEHRLGAAEMRVRRHHGLAGRLRLMRERVDERRERVLNLADAPPEVQPEVERDLLVA